MSQQLLNNRDIEFLLYEILDTQALSERRRYQEYSMEIFSATLERSKTLAEKYFANHNTKSGANEPTFYGKK
jgi:butyryl-CoA dehydrogenase